MVREHLKRYKHCKSVYSHIPHVQSIKHITNQQLNSVSLFHHVRAGVGQQFICCVTQAPPTRYIGTNQAYPIGMTEDFHSLSVGLLSAVCCLFYDRTSLHHYLQEETTIKLVGTHTDATLKSEY